MDGNDSKTKGAVQISDEVISLIATTAAMEIEGVAQISVKMMENIIDKLGKKNATKGVSIAVNDGKVSIDINITVYYEYNILTVAQQVQKNVKSIIETMTNMETPVVNVNVVGLELKKPEQQAQ